VPAVFQWRTCMSRTSSTREQENPEGREGISVANQSGPIGFFHESTMSSSSYPSLITQPTTVTTDHREGNLFGHLPPTATLPGKLLRHPRNLAIVELFSSPIWFIVRIYFPLVHLHNQGYPKVCPDPLNLPNTGDPFARTSSLSSCSLFFPDQGLNCFDLESFRVFFVKFPKPSLFQISELLHFIDFRKKFIKMQNQFYLNL
jgi:hypothetical protein